MKYLRPFAICFSLILVLAISSCSKTATTSPYTLSSPANNSTNVPLNQVFTCAALNNVTTYEFTFIDANATYQTGRITTVVNNTTATNLTGSFTSLASGHSYTWSVIFTTTTGATQQSPSWSFVAQ